MFTCFLKTPIIHIINEVDIQWWRLMYFRIGFGERCVKWDGISCENFFLQTFQSNSLMATSHLFPMSYIWSMNIHNNFSMAAGFDWCGSRKVRKNKQIPYSSNIACFLEIFNIWSMQEEHMTDKGTRFDFHFQHHDCNPDLKDAVWQEWMTTVVE